MADNRQRIEAVAAQFGQAEKISIFLGPVKIYPGKELSDQAVSRIENALRSPESEKGTIRVLEDKELVYRSSQGEVDTDIKGVAKSLQGRQEPSINTLDNKVGSSRNEIELQNLEKVPDGVKLQKETNFKVESESLESLFAKFDHLAAESPATADNVTLKERVNQLDLVETPQQSRLENQVSEPVMSSAYDPDDHDPWGQKWAYEPADEHNCNRIAEIGRIVLEHQPNAVSEDNRHANWYDIGTNIHVLEYQPGGVSVNNKQINLDSFPDCSEKKYSIELKDDILTVSRNGEAILKAENGQVENLGVLNRDFDEFVEIQSAMELIGEPEEINELVREKSFREHDHYPLAQQNRYDGQTPNVAENAVREPIQPKQLTQDPVSPCIQDQVTNGNALVQFREARQSQPKLTIPLNPTTQQLDQKMPEIVNPAGTTNHASTETALAAAHARIDSLQTQLDEAKKSIQDLSKFVHEPSLKHWAQTKAQEIGKTSQTITEQAKNKMMQWMQSKADQMKEAVHQKVKEAKTVAQGKISDVTTLAQDKASEIITVTQGKLNHVKTSVQDKVTEVKTAAELKAIEVKEAARSQVNQFLAPVNTEKVELSAKRLIQTYGDGSRYTKAATHSYSMNEKGDISISRQSDKAVVFQQGGVTKAATSDDILKMKALPSQLGQIMAAQRQTTQKQELEVG